MTATTITPAAQENRYLGDPWKAHARSGRAHRVLNLCLEDGTRIGSHVPFVKAMVEAARAWASDSLNCPRRSNGLRRA
jgi:hypothetical protein